MDAPRQLPEPSIFKKNYKTFSAKSIMRPLSIYSAQKFNKKRFFKKWLALHRFILLSKYDVWSLRRKKFQMGYKIRTLEVQIFVRCKRSKWGTVGNPDRIYCLKSSWPFQSIRLSSTEGSTNTSCIGRECNLLKPRTRGYLIHTHLF